MGLNKTDNLPSGLTMLYEVVGEINIDSTRTQNAKVNYFRDKYAHSYESMRKVYEPFVKIY